MTTTLLESLPTTRPDQYLYLEDVSWECYEMLVMAAHEEHLQITYDRGRMEIMSPSMRHERVKHLLGMMVGILAMERNISMQGLGSTTFRHKLLKKGLEPDQCFYVQNEEKIRFKDEFDLDVDPPPDLAIEVDVTSRSIHRMPIYAALGVPEVWRHSGLRVQSHWLVDGEYQLNEKSRCFPFLNLSDINYFLDLRASVEETLLLKKFRDWAGRDI